MTNPTTLVADLYTWAARYGLLTDAGMREASTVRGDASRVPFDEDEADFFRMRKIMRIRAEDQAGRQVITIFTRQAIAERKAQRLVRTFAERFHDVSLAVTTAPTYRIDQTLQSYGPFQPIRMNGDKIACGSSIGIGNQRNAGTLTALARSTDGVRSSVFRATTSSAAVGRLSRGHPSLCPASRTSPSISPTSPSSAPTTPPPP
jgi:hypothetical protein